MAPISGGKVAARPEPFGGHNRSDVVTGTENMNITPIDVFNLLVPKDFGSRRLASGIAYGRNERHKLDIYGPRRRPATAALPVVVFFYGGSWETGDRASYAFVGRALASLGYIVVIPDYRLLPEIEYPAFLDDCAEAVSWVSHNINRHGGDFTRMALAGHSAGAYNAAMLALAPNLLSARGLLPGLRGVAGLSGPYDFYPFDGEVSRRVFGHAPEPQATQPISHINAASPAMWLGTGDKDRLVLPRNSDNLAGALRNSGVDAEARHYNGLDHAGTLLALSWPLRLRAPVLADMGEFLRRIFAA